jgi:2-polyprenyl-3-methyl-5-hydroxy-6-metoxy-1,4-benzoquinol methylase
MTVGNPACYSEVPIKEYKMPIQPNLVERTAFYALNAAPAPMLDLAGMLAYQALSTAVRLDIFNCLAERAASPAELAVVLGADEPGLERLLQALEGIGYVEEQNGRYRNSGMTEKWFLNGAQIDMKSAVTTWDTFVHDLWPHSAQIIRSGERPFDFYAYTASTPGLSDAHQRMMMGNANLVGPDIVKKVTVPKDATRLLDVGGGHGMFSILFCQAHPWLQATIIDDEAALKTARENVAAQGLDIRISLQADDLWQANWGEDNDLILLFNLLHHYDLETCGKLLDKAHGALGPGGQVAIFDQVEGTVSGSAANAVVRLVALMYYLFANGRAFKREELEGLLYDSGFQNLQFHPLRQAPGSSLIVAER